MRIKIIWIAVAAIVIAGLFGFGVLTSDSSVGWLRHVFFRGKGAVSQIGTTTVSSGSVPQARHCRQNLQRIQAAKRKAGQERGNPIGAVTWEEVLVAMFPDKQIRRLPSAEINKIMPRCPSGGTYALDTLEGVAKCSIAGNNSLTIEDDHIIRD